MQDFESECDNEDCVVGPDYNCGLDYRGETEGDTSETGCALAATLFILFVVSAIAVIYYSIYS